MSSPLELNGPVGIPNSNIFHHMKTVILFAMMVVVICVRSIEIESVQVCNIPYVLPHKNFKMTAELIKSWIVRDLGEAQNQHAHRILRGRLSRKSYLLFRFSIILRYFLKSVKSKHGPSLEFLEIKGVDRPMQRLS